MVEFLELMQAGLAVTAVTITVATAPVAIVTGNDVPDIRPLLEIIDQKDSDNI